MDRRDFLKTTSGAAAAAATVVAASAPAVAEASARAVAEAPAIGPGVRELRLATPWATGVAGLADQARRLAQRIETLSGGRYRVAISGSGSDELNAVGRDDAELYFTAGDDHVRTHRAFAYFHGLPGEHGLAAHDLEAWMLAGGGQMLLDDLAGDFGVKVLLAGHTGAEPPVWLKRPIGALDDLRDQSIFARGLGRDVIAGLGARPAAIADDDGVAASFAAGGLLAVSSDGMTASHAAGLHRHAAQVVTGGLSRHGAALSLGISRTVWDGLDAADQEMLAAAAAAEFHLSLAAERAHASLLTKTMERSGGPALGSWPTDVATALSRVSSAVIAHVARSDAKARRISASYEAFASALGSVGAGRPVA